MSRLELLSVIWVAFCIIDAIVYGFVRYPERTQLGIVRFIPGGGFIALFLHGRKR